MRLRIALDVDLVDEITRRAGPRREVRSSRNSCGVVSIEHERHWDNIEATLGGLPDTGHEWDTDSAAWTRRQRHADPRRAG
ncbi:MAG: hypothetical protein F4X11_20060 [Acidobacteria bacterium]|nr:hypothetical protein [Acidobacteriota bacterium]